MRITSGFTAARFHPILQTWRAHRGTDFAAPLGTPVRVEPRLREHGLGSWEGLTREDVARDLPEQYADWVEGRPVRGRGGEDPAAVALRALAALSDLPPAPVAVLVTHGGTGGRLVEALLGLGPEHRRIFGPLGNCHWTELAHQGSRWRVLRHNASATGGAPAAGLTGALRPAQARPGAQRQRRRPTAPR